MRVPFMKKLTLEDFEFSQTHLFFWDKVCANDEMMFMFVSLGFDKIAW